MDGAQVPGPSVEWWHVLSRSLRFAAKILYEIMLFRVSMLDETRLYAPSMAHIILAPPSLAGHFCVVRLAAHVSNGLKSRIRPVVGRI